MSMSEGDGADTTASTGTYDTKDLAKLIQCSERHIRRMDADREIPGRIQIRRLVRYSREAVDKWLSGEQQIGTNHQAEQTQQERPNQAE